MVESFCYIAINNLNKSLLKFLLANRADYMFLYEGLSLSTKGGNKNLSKASIWLSFIRDSKKSGLKVM